MFRYIREYELPTGELPTYILITVEFKEVWKSMINECGKKKKKIRGAPGWLSR